MSDTCMQCKGEMGESPSDDFCAEKCQTAWLRARWGEDVSVEVPFAPRNGLPHVVGAPTFTTGPAGSPWQWLTSADEAA